MIPKYPIYHLLLAFFFVGCSKQQTEQQTETKPETATPAEPGPGTIPEKFHGLWHLDDDGTLRPIDYYMLVTETKLYSFKPDGEQTWPAETAWVVGDTVWILEGRKEKPGVDWELHPDGNKLTVRYKDGDEWPYIREHDAIDPTAAGKFLADRYEKSPESYRNKMPRRIVLPPSDR